MNEQKQPTLLRLPEVIRRVGNLSKSTIYQRISEGTFPVPISLGGKNARAVAWLSNEIDDFINNLIEASRNPEKEATK